MPIFTDHLRTEIQSIRNGLSQLETVRSSIPDLRLTTYTMRLIFKRIHLAKLETVLYPALDASCLRDGECFDEMTERLRNRHADSALMRLQMAVDRFDERSSGDDLSRALADCAHSFEELLDNEINVVLPFADRQLSAERQGELLAKALEIDRASMGVDLTQALNFKHAEGMKR
jgi:hypothetical protein